MFFSVFARNLSRNEILVVGILLEKGALRRGTVLKNSKLVTWSGLPIRTVERVIARLMYLKIVTRRESGRNFEYRVSLAGARKLERPTFPDRISLSAQLNFDGFGYIPRRVRIGEDELNMADATLSDLRKLREHLEKKQKNLVHRTGRLEETVKLISLVLPRDAVKPGITVREVIELEKDSGADRSARAKVAQKSTAASGTSQS
jgi:DNA-binding transcriptional ArsR family regulator